MRKQAPTLNLNASCSGHCLLHGGQETDKSVKNNHLGSDFTEPCLKMQSPSLPLSLQAKRLFLCSNIPSSNSSKIFSKGKEYAKAADKLFNFAFLFHTYHVLTTHFIVERQ